MDIDDFNDDDEPEAAPVKGRGKKRGMKPGHTYAKVKNDAIAKALIENHGVISLAAKQLNLSRDAVQKRIDRTVFLQEICAQIDAKILDLAEAKLFNALANGDMPTVRWYLERKGKTRGYATKIDQDLSPETVAAVVKELKESGLDGLKLARQRLVGKGEVVPFTADRA